MLSQVATYLLFESGSLTDLKPVFAFLALELPALSPCLAFFTLVLELKIRSSCLKDKHPMVEHLISWFLQPQPPLGESGKSFV